MLPPHQQIWIDAGYATMARQGPAGLMVEPLAREVGKNKSSFYHHFADLEVFTEALLRHHLAQAAIMADKERDCQTLDDLIEVLLGHKLDLLFNRQLRVHRQRADFTRCFEQTNQLTAVAMQQVWARILGLERQLNLADMVLQLSLENFFLQITEATLREDWLRQYFGRLQSMVQQFQHQPSPPVER